MPINNINTLQNYDDLKYVTDAAKQDSSGNLNTDYYIHALANLEQRNEYRYSNGIKYGILTYDREVTVASESQSTSSLSFINNVSFDILVNNIETYLKHSKIYNDGASFKSLLFGKILGTDDNAETSNVEIQYTDINLEKHIINEAYRVFHLNDPLNDSVYILIHIHKINDPGFETTYKYELNVYKLILKNDSNIVNIFRSSTYTSSNYSGSNVNNSEFSIDNTDAFEELISSCSIYSQETIENNYTLNCSYDTIDEQLIKITDESIISSNYDKINELLYFNYYNIDQYIRAINNDLTITYPNLLKYYSNRQFNSNNETLKDIIARSLFDYIKNKLPEKEQDQCELIIPKNTQITYVSNVENELQLYYTDDIYIHLINNNIYNVDANKNIDGIIFKYTGIDKTIIYNIYSKYNTKYKEFVDSFIVTQKYILPYIDDSHLWNINGNQTTIYASGESAGNPNIFLIKTYLNNDELNVNQLNRTDISQNLLIYEEKIIPIYYKNLYNYSDDIDIEQQKIQYVFKIPVINNKTIDKLKYATLFLISNVAKDNTGYYIAPPITTIWTINNINDDNERKFEAIKLADNNYLTLDDMLGLDAMIYKKFTEYGHISNIFDNMISLRLPYVKLNGSQTNNVFNYFSIERNKNIKYEDPINYPFDTYNYNLVEFNIHNDINKQLFAYATSSNHTDKKYFSLWDNNGRKTKPQFYVKVKNYTEQTGQATANIPRYSSTNVTNNNPSGISEQSVGNQTSTTNNNTVSEQNIIIDISENIGQQIYNTEYRELPEYIPSSYIPTIKESNILHQDNNIINRTNIYSFDKYNVNDLNKIHYAYIGTSCTDSNKNRLHIGTSDFSYMINLGQNYLVDKFSDDMFKKTEYLSLDMTYTDITSKITSIKNTTELNNIIEHKNYNSTIDVFTINIDHIYNPHDPNNAVKIFNAYSKDGYNDTVINKDNSNFNIDTFVYLKNETSETSDTKSKICEYLKQNYKELLDIMKLNGINDFNDTHIELISQNNGGFFDGNNLIKNGKIFNDIIMFDEPLVVRIIIYTSNTGKDFKIII